jgi:hypothetical protein
MYNAGERFRAMHQKLDELLDQYGIIWPSPAELIQLERISNEQENMDNAVIGSVEDPIVRDRSTEGTTGSAGNGQQS